MAPSVRQARGRLPVLVALAIAVLPALGSTPAGAEAADRRVVLIMVEHFTWRDAPRSLDGFARASLALKTAEWEGTSAHGWFTVGIGRRGAVAWPIATLPEPDPGAPEISFEFPNWQRIVSFNASLHYGGTPGAFGGALERSGRTWRAIADDPEATLATVDERGTVRHFVRGGAPELRRAVDDGVDVVVVSTSDPATVDDLVAAAGSLCTVVASVSSPTDAIHLGVLAASPTCGLGSGSLESPSTRQAPFVSIVDVAATVLDRAGIERVSSMTGLPATPSGSATVADLIDEDARARRTGEFRDDFGWAFVALACLAPVVLALRRRASVLGAAVIAAVPVSTYLIMVVPWTAGGWVVGVALVAGCAGAIGGGAYAAWGRRAPELCLFAVAVVSAVVLVGDAVRGGTLELDAPFGNSPIIAGRFAGLGNVAFASSMGSVLVASTIAVHRWGPKALRWVVVACGAFALAGAPPLGDKVGLVPVWVPTAGVLLLALRREPLRRSRLALLVLAAFVVLGAFAVFDLLHADEAQSHLGRWLSSGDGVETIRRKAVSMGRTFLGGTLRFAVPVPLLVLVLRRRTLLAVAWLRPLLLATTSAVVLGTLMNDSGIEVAAAVLAVTWPALLVLARRETERAAPLEPIGADLDRAEPSPVVTR